MAPRNRFAGVLLIAAMAAGSAIMWIGCPVFWLWLASHLQKSSQPSLGPYLLVIFGIPISMAVVGKTLGKLNRVYGEVTGKTPQVRVRLPWHRSMRGERGSGHPRTVLDVVMVASVAVCGSIFLVWFFVFAGSSLPG